MARRDCPPGSEWDALVNACIPSRTDTRAGPGPTTELPLAVNNGDSVLVLSQALWIFVVLATLGSILALAIWFIIFKRQARLSSSTSEDAEQQQEPLEKTEPPVIIHSLPSENSEDILQRVARALSSCHQPQLGAQTGSKCGEDFTACRDCTKHGRTEWGGGLPTCSTMREHRIPLPATELGGTALVTTKTV